MFSRYLNWLGASVIGVFWESGKIVLFFLSACYWLFRRPFRPRLVIEQLYFIGNKSVFIICLTALFTGLVFAIQFYFGFRLINADALVGPASALSLARELAPVFTAIVITGRAGAAMAAEIGTMRITDQIDAMEVMAVSPIQYLVSPRILAGLLALPLMSALFLFFGNIGAYIAGVYLLKIDSVLFFSHLLEFVFIVDIFQGLIKAALFGAMVTTIGTYAGYNTSGGAAAVGNSTNRAVVITLVVILISDYFLTLVIRFFLYRSLE